MVSFGKKRKEETVGSAATVSSIPVPPIENSLVIDLPEGQKLVLGKMEDGTVIEVATWRGTGRPDSRTNRLMLGVSSGVAPAATGAPSAGADEQVSLATKVREALLFRVSKLIRLLQALSRRAVRYFSTRLLKRHNSEGAVDSSGNSLLVEANLDQADLDFEGWLRTFDQSPLVDSKAESTPSKKGIKKSRPDGTAGGPGYATHSSRKNPSKKSRKRR